MSLIVHAITFNPFEENTYIIGSDQGDCIIIDPGCSDQAERDELIRFIKNLQRNGQKIYQPIIRPGK